MNFLDLLSIASGWPSHTRPGEQADMEWMAEKFHRYAEKFTSRAW